MHMRFGLLLFGIVAILSAETALTAHAQVNGSPVSANVLPLPPVGFDALNAPAADKIKYGVPPAPVQLAAPAAFAQWQKAVAIPLSLPHPAAPTPVLQVTPKLHGPAKGMTPFASNANSILAGGSYNWSGPVVYNKKAPFKTGAIVGEFVVPTAHQALGTCSGGTDYSSEWVGLDGFSSNDVLQAGIEADAYCANNVTSPTYYIWIEWYPDWEYMVTSPSWSVNPGDLIFIEVWNTTATSGTAYFHNYSTGQILSVQLTAPAGTKLVGDSAEWVVERPTIVSGGVPNLATLTNYVDISLPLGLAWNTTASNPTYYYPGANPSAGNMYLLSMVDDNGKVISTPTIENFNFVWFQNSGSSYSASAQKSDSMSVSSSSPY